MRAIQTPQRNRVLKILVIGSVHLDIIADVEPETADNVDKVGCLNFSVGGTAFNIAASISFHGKTVALYSVIGRDSFSFNILRKELARRRLISRYIKRVPSMPESGFVGIMRKGTLVSAVSCVGIDSAVLDLEDLKRAIHRATLVAIECNLAVEQIRQIIAITQELHKPLCISAVSESKVDRIRQAIQGRGATVFRVVMLNELEARRVFGNSLDNAATACRDLATENVVLSQAEKGFTVLRPRRDRILFSPIIENVISTLGAGDALFAAFCDHFSTRNELSEEAIISDAKKYLEPVLQSKYATPILGRRRRKS